MRNYYGFIIMMAEAMLFPNVMVAQNENTDKTTKAYNLMSKYYAVYKIIPQTAIVAEMYGTAGEACSKPEYKVGLRWEPNSHFEKGFY